VAAWSEGIDDYVRVIDDGQQQGVFCEGDPTDLAILSQAVMQVQMARAIERGEREPSAVVESILAPLLRVLGVAP